MNQTFRQKLTENTSVGNHLDTLEILNRPENKACHKQFNFLSRIHVIGIDSSPKDLGKAYYKLQALRSKDHITGLSQ